jgi:hypothetical protein
VHVRSDPFGSIELLELAAESKKKKMCSADLVVQNGSLAQDMTGQYEIPPAFQMFSGQNWL